jgi:hypothetical protein
VTLPLDADPLLISQARDAYLYPGSTPSDPWRRSVRLTVREELNLGAGVPGEAWLWTTSDDFFLTRGEFNNRMMVFVKPTVCQRWTDKEKAEQRSRMWKMCGQCVLFPFPFSRFES